MIVAKYKCGSQLFFDNPNDIDYLIVCENNRERKELLCKTKVEQGKDNHFTTIEKMNTTMRLGDYALPYLELIEGKDNLFDKYKIWNWSRNYKGVLKYYAEKLPKDDKKWYHIYLGVKALMNGRDKKFTSQQLEVAQKIKENGISERLYKTIIDYLS